MNSFLLYITIGPVQDFILQARRTRDLWYGSHLLSELSRSIARTLADGGATLVFPSLQKGDHELAPCPSPFRPDGHPGADLPPLAVANIIIATVSKSESEVGALATKARDEMQAYLTGTSLAGRVWEDCQRLIAVDPRNPAKLSNVWNEQVGSLVDFNAAWTELRNDYSSARERITREIGARKNLRDFSQWTNQRGGVPKSSLDGARETVLKRPKERPKRLTRKYRLGDGEQLDAIGLLKRAGGMTADSRRKHHLQFIPLTNVALSSWMAHAKRTAPTQFDSVLSEARRWHSESNQQDNDERLELIARGNIPWVKAFPHDASVFLKHRWWPTFKEQGLLQPNELIEFESQHPNQDPPARLLEAWRKEVEAWGHRIVDPLLVRAGTPTPYVACLVADGDGMGRAIETLNSVEANQVFSKALAGFATEAREIVEKQHFGSLVFAGGDDVLAFVPVSHAAACADALRRDFAHRLSYVSSEPKPTLSVGIGIGHVLESMSDLLELGRQAEKRAKGSDLPKGQDRNALCILLDKRSGGQRYWRQQWTSAPLEALASADAILSKKTLSVRKVYEIEDILGRLPSPGRINDTDGLRVLTGEISRSLKRVEGRAQPTMADIGLHLPGGCTYAEASANVSNWISRILIARAIAEATP